MSIFNNIFGSFRKQEEPVVTPRPNKVYRHYCVLTLVNDESVRFEVDYDQQYNALEIMADLPYVLQVADNANEVVARSCVVSLTLVSIEDRSDLNPKW